MIARGQERQRQLRNWADTDQGLLLPDEGRATAWNSAAKITVSSDTRDRSR